MRDLYLDTPGLTDRVRRAGRASPTALTNPYEQAKALADFLHGDASFDVPDEPVPSPRTARTSSTSSCSTRRAVGTGYCQYYASAMAIMARSLGLPARVAVGFAPGRAAGDGPYLVREANAHAWAEIYFPGYGWQIFEATKSINPRFVACHRRRQRGRRRRGP